MQVKTKIIAIPNTDAIDTFADLLDVITNHVYVIRSEEGVNQGVVIFQTEDGRRAVLKVHHHLDATNVLMADAAIELVGLPIAKSYPIEFGTETFGTIATTLSGLRCDRFKYKPRKDQTLLLMPFSKFVTLSDWNSENIDEFINTHYIWIQIGQVLMLDLITGNHDRCISLNLGNMMINPETKQLCFIDNNTDYEKPRTTDALPADIEKIIKALEGNRKTSPIQTLIGNIERKYGKLTDYQKIGIRKFTSRGFRSAYARIFDLTKTSKLERKLTELAHTEHGARVKDFILGRIQKLIAVETPIVTSLLQTQVLEGLGSSDMNQLRLAYEILKSKLPEDSDIVASVSRLIDLKRKLKETPRDTSILEQMKELRLYLIPHVSTMTF